MLKLDLRGSARAPWRNAVMRLLLRLVICLAAVSTAIAPAHAEQPGRTRVFQRQLAPPIQIVAAGGEQAVIALITAAKQRILIEAFALSDTTVITALESARLRGVDVRVMLDPRGLNTGLTEGALRASGVLTRAPNPAFAVTHVNAVVIDAAAVAVLTSALTPEGLRSADAGYIAIDRDRVDVVQAAGLFYDDWLRRPTARFARNLFVLPDDAPAVASLIAGARRRIDLYTSYLSDATVIGALESARGRGVAVRVLTPQRSNNAALRRLGGRGEVRFGGGRGGTVLVIDRSLVLMGSMDLVASTLTDHRELGIFVIGGPAGAGLDRSFLRDYARGVVLRPAPARALKKGKTSRPNALLLRVEVSTVVRVGGEAVVVVATTPGARVRITVVYPLRSKPARGTTGAVGYALKDGSFVYRWIVAGQVQPGAALVRVQAQLGGRVAAVEKSVAVVR